MKFTGKFSNDSEGWKKIIGKILRKLQGKFDGKHNNNF